HHEGLRRSRAREDVVEAELGDARAGTANVSGRRVCKKILAGAVETRSFRNRSGREKRLPGELMDLGAPLAPRVRHDDRNVVAGVADETVDSDSSLLHIDIRPFYPTNLSLAHCGRYCEPNCPSER